MRKMGCSSFKPKTQRPKDATPLRRLVQRATSIHRASNKRPRRRKRNTSTFVLQSSPVLGCLTSHCRVFTVAVRLFSLPRQRTLTLGTRQHWTQYGCTGYPSKSPSAEIQQRASSSGLMHTPIPKPTRLQSPTTYTMGRNADSSARPMSSAHQQIPPRNACILPT